MWSAPLVPTLSARMPWHFGADSPAAAEPPLKIAKADPTTRAATNVDAILAGVSFLVERPQRLCGAQKAKPRTRSRSESTLPVEVLLPDAVWLAPARGKGWMRCRLAPLGAARRSV